MKWPQPLIQAKLIKRYKRFLADIEIDQKLLTAHVPNTGSMTGCWEPNWPCALSVSSNPNRKMAHTLELTYNGLTWIGVNTGNANSQPYVYRSDNTYGGSRRMCFAIGKISCCCTGNLWVRIWTNSGYRSAYPWATTTGDTNSTARF